MKKTTVISMAVLILFLSAFMILPSMMVSADIIGGLEAGKNELQSGIISLFSRVIAPIIALAGAAVSIFLIAGTALKHKRNEDYSDKIAPCVIAVAITLLFGAWSIWGPALFG